MKDLEFEWDPQKEISNIKKHGVSFEEAMSVFYDEAAILFDDPDHSKYEERFLLIGFSAYANLLIISHCIRGDDNIIRIISARKATVNERNTFADYNMGRWKE